MVPHEPDTADGPRLMKFVFTSGPAAVLADMSTCRSPLVCGALGWILSSPPIDAGVPVDVQKVLGNALCRSSKVTFLDSGISARPGTSWTTITGGQACVLPRSGLTSAWLGRVAFPLRCSEDPRMTVRLFQDAAFPWELGGQAVLLSSRDAPPPPLTYDLVTSAFSPKRFIALFSSVPSLLALMLPGPDGDFARFIAPSTNAWVPVFRGIMEACAEAAAPLCTVDAATFDDIRWFNAEDAGA